MLPPSPLFGSACSCACVVDGLAKVLTGAVRVCVAAAQKMIRCDLATDWAFADKSAPLYAHMESLERLPIPEVKPTLEMYLHSVRPFLTDKEFDAYKVPPARDARSPTHARGATRRTEAARSLW